MQRGPNQLKNLTYGGRIMAIWKSGKAKKFRAMAYINVNN